MLTRLLQHPRVALEHLDRGVVRADALHGLLELGHGQLVVAALAHDLGDQAARIAVSGVALVDLLEVADCPVRVSQLARQGRRLHELTRLLE